MSDVMIVPRPVRVERQAGQFVLTARTLIVATGEAAPVAQQLRTWIAPATGFELEIGGALPADDRPAIVLQLDAELAALGREGYRLSVTPRQVSARASTPTGLLHALQSLRQVLPPEIFGATPAQNVAWVIPCVEIEDYPRFSWRGAMLDVGRHFMPKDFVLKFIDLLALHKMNTFHWHLTEDQGWRLEIRQYPRLTEVGAWRKETLIGHMRSEEGPWQFDGTPYGGCYTQAEAREVVAYAQARGITVVPEIEMPGHAQAAVTAYPELGNTGEAVGVRTVWGVSEHVFNAQEPTLRFLQNVLDEVLDIFPSPFIHIGGDEAPKKQWQASAAAQARMRELGLHDEEELQSYFIRRMDAFLTARGRRLIGWDEILEGGLAPNATVMSWRGTEGGVAAAQSGHDVVMAPTHSTYLDYYQSEDRANEPLAIGGYVPLEKIYAFDPYCPGLDADHVQHVLGTQAQVWTEYIASPEHVEYMAFPRLCALSEVAWTPRADRAYADFRARLNQHLPRLKALNVNYRDPAKP